MTSQQKSRFVESISGSEVLPMVLRIVTLRETNIAPESRPGYKRTYHLPTIDFQAQTVSFRDCYELYTPEV